MRLLSMDDLRWVSGGLPASGSEGEVVYENGSFFQWYNNQWHEVVEPVGINPPHPNPPSPPTFPDPGGPPSGGGGGGGGGQPADTHPQGWNSCLDHKTDKAVSLINAEIQSKSNKDYVEWGAYLWKDANGNVHSSQLIEGTNFGVPGMAGLPSDFGFTSWDQVIGIVHSHPKFAQITAADGTISYIESTPESHWELPSAGLAGSVGQGDWIISDFLVANGADAINFRQYISYRGDIYEYDYYQNNNTALSNTQRSAQSVAASDYDPNAQCAP